jgi:hypothetical protein
MSETSAKTNHGLDRLRLWIVIVPLRIAGFIFLAMGVGKIIIASGTAPPQRASVEGVVISKSEKPVAGQDRKILSITVAPDKTPLRRVRRVLDETRWTAIAVGDRYADPVRGAPAPGPDVGAIWGGIRSAFVGLLLLVMARLCRRAHARRLARLTRPMSSPERDLNATLKKLTIMAAEMNSKVKAGSATVRALEVKSGSVRKDPSAPKPAAAPKPPARRTATVTRAGWF